MSYKSIDSALCDHKLVSTLADSCIAALCMQTAIGHWSEMLFPLFSILRLEPTFARPPDQLVLLHLKKIHLMEWVRSVLAVTLGVAANQDLPPIMLHEEVDSVWKQICE